MRRVDRYMEEKRAQARIELDFRARGARPCVICGADTSERRQVSAWSVPACSSHSTEITHELTLTGGVFKAKESK